MLLPAAADLAGERGRFLNALGRWLEVELWARSSADANPDF